MTKHQLVVDSSPLSLAARMVAVVAGHTPSDIALSSGPALTYGAAAAGSFAVLTALSTPPAGSKLGSAVGGATDAEKAQVADWAAILAKDGGAAPSLAFLQRLDAHLLASSFLPLAAYRPTTVDYAAWATIVSGGAGAGGAFDAKALPNLARWSRAVVASVPRSGAAAEAFLKGTPLAAPEAEVQLPASNIFAAAAAIAAENKARAAAPAPAAASASAAAAPPAAGAKADAKKGAAEGDKKKAAAPAAAASAASAAAPAAAAGAKEAKPAKEKKPAAAAAASASAAPAGEVNQIYRVDFRVGRITSVAAHPTEARMYVQQIDVGAESGGVRTVVSGLAEHFKPAELQNRLVVVMVNVKSGDIKGVESAGRVMVATSADGASKEMAAPPAEAKVGEQVSFAGVPASSKPDQPIAPKRLHEIMSAPHAYRETTMCARVAPLFCAPVLTPSLCLCVFLPLAQEGSSYQRKQGRAILRFRFHDLRGSCHRGHHCQRHCGLKTNLPQPTSGIGGAAQHSAGVHSGSDSPCAR